MTSFSSFGGSVLPILLLFFFIHNQPTAAQQNNVIKVRTYVDHTGLLKWMKVTGKSLSQLDNEMRTTINEVSLIMQQVGNRNIQLSVEMDNHTTFTQSILPTREGEINSVTTSIGLDSFRKFLSITYDSNPFDIAILWTGADLISTTGRNSTLGHAENGRPCQLNGIAIMELSGTYQDVLVAAHEIAHILGCSHDGTGDARECPARSGYIMAPTTFHSRNQYFYSNCCKSTIRNTIYKLNRDRKNCFNEPAGVPAPQRIVRYGSMITADEACKRKFGPSSYVVRKFYGSYGDNICVNLRCRSNFPQLHNGLVYHNSIQTPAGLPCGVNKHCDKGHCVRLPQGINSVTLDTCPFGDQPKIEEGKIQSCNELNTVLCTTTILYTTEFYNKTCCSKCNLSNPGAGYTADDVCRVMVGQHSSLAKNEYSGQSDDEICESKLRCILKRTGYGYRLRRVTIPNGMECGRNKACYNGRCR